MVIEFDEKGKYYTEVITKDIILSHIQTQTYRIRGNIHVRKDERLSDEVNSEKGFLAVTDAEVFSLNGESLYTCSFMVVNRSHIVWVMPVESDRSKPEQGDEG